MRSCASLPRSKNTIFPVSPCGELIPELVAAWGALAEGSQAAGKGGGSLG